MLSSDGFAGLVAERDGEVLGSAFVDERDVIAGIGPVTVDPAAQDDGIGRALMEAALERERDRGARRGQARADRLPLPLARAVREARVRRPRAAVGPAGHPAGCRHPRSGRPAGARG